jgi:hypothetical protein
MITQRNIDRAALDLIDTAIAVHGAKVEHLTREQLAEALKQAVACGDFIRLIDPAGGQQVTYIPYRREQELKAEIAKLKASFQQSGEARTGWLNEFDGYKLQILELRQRLSSARFLVEQIVSTPVHSSDVLRAAKLWLEKTP